MKRHQRVASIGTTLKRRGEQESQQKTAVFSRHVQAAQQYGHGACGMRVNLHVGKTKTLANPLCLHPHGQPIAGGKKL